MNVFCEQEEKVTVVTLEGSVSVPETEKFRDFMMQRINGGAQNILLDFTKVSYIDSSGVSVLLTLLQAARRKGGDIRLAGLNRHIQEVIRQIGLHHVFKRYESVDEGKKSFEAVGSA